jgi:DNA-binding beta-propeller fold protein YncE
MKLLINIILLYYASYLIFQGTDSLERVSFQEDRFIRYVTTLPDPGKKDDTGLFGKIFNFIAGNEPVIFNSPVTVTSTGIQNIWIVNQGDGTILRHLNGNTEKAMAFKKKGYSFPSLIGICSFGEEGVLFTDSQLNGVYQLSGDGKQYKRFNDTVNLVRPTGIAYSESSGEIWVVETGSHRISVFNRSGVRTGTIGKRGSGPLEFNFPTYIWIDSSGRIYIVDSMNFRIQILSSKGDFIGSFGKQGDVTGTFARPRGIATDSKGNIYVVDALFNTVQIFDISGRLLYYFGTQGRGDYQFWMPSGIFIDKNDFIYVSDSYNSRIQVFQLIQNIQK